MALVRLACRFFWFSCLVCGLSLWLALGGWRTISKPQSFQNARRRRVSLAAIPCRIYRISSDLRSQAAQGLVSTGVGDCLGTPSGAASFSPSSPAATSTAGNARALQRGRGRAPRVKPTSSRSRRVLLCSSPLVHLFFSHCSSVPLFFSPCSSVLLTLFLCSSPLVPLPPDL